MNVRAVHVGLLLLRFLWLLLLTNGAAAAAADAAAAVAVAFYYTPYSSVAHSRVSVYDRNRKSPVHMKPM